MSYLSKIKQEFGEYIDWRYGIDNCRNDDDGVWIYLKEQYQAVATECSTIHENTLKDCYFALKQGIKTN